MLNLHAAYYHNIWPFEGRDCSLLFDQGKFLIKAPIGSGKSFLFFDGPSYALYRTASRNMLNIHSKEGEISLIFSEGETYYLVRRFLKPGKSKDSCSSQLFTISFQGGDILKTLQHTFSVSRHSEKWGEALAEPKESLSWTEWRKETLWTKSSFETENSNILLRNINIIKTISSNPDTFHLEEIVMKNETDLQQHIDQLLPPKPVFLSTMFLLQDAENIFEMQPADRLTVLKNVFGLLGIDEAKEQVQDKKREISYKLKALQDQSHQDLKLRKRLKELHNNYLLLASRHCEEGESSVARRGNLNNAEKFFTDLSPFLDQITLNDFSLNGLDSQLFLSLQQELQTKEKHFFTLQTSKDHLTKQITEHQQQLQKRQTEQTQMQRDIASLEQKIASIDTNQIEKLKKEKADLYQKQEALEQNAQVTFSPDKGRWHEVPEGFANRNISTLSDIILLINDLKERWKDLANQVQQAELQLKNLELEAKNQQIKLDQLEQAKKRLNAFEGTIEEQSTFSCEKIWTNCPFIKVINKQHFDQLEKQKSTLQQEIEQLERTVVAFPLDKGEGGAQQGVVTPWEATEGGLLQDIENKKKQMEQLKSFLTDIDYKSREEKYTQKETLQKQIQTTDQAIMKLEEETQKLQDYQNQKTAFSTSLENLTKQLQNGEEQKTRLQQEIATLDEQLNSQAFNDLKTQLQTVTNMLQTLHDIEQLITDATATKNLVKDLQHQEKLLTNLYAILSKEILLFALDEYLPVLSEIINSFLVQVVDYQIAMKITETSEKLELEAKIYDEKGEREVKSLSWGQRTILKLVRMLAISSYLQTPLLFLDETINNLDTDTIGKVSEMLNNFVKQRTMKFYTVTHNTEIQEMDIWDRIIEI